MSKSDSSMIELCGLWERTSQNGREYIGGRVADGEDLTIPAGSFVMIFPNESDNPKAPSFRALFSPPRDGDGQRSQQPQQKGRFDRFKGGGQQQPSQQAPQQHRGPQPGDADHQSDDDIPF